MKTRIRFLVWLSILTAVAARAEAALTFFVDLGTAAGRRDIL